MGRHKTIDREKVLEAAERLVSQHGSAALTIQAVATAAGISKGGVQSCFENKEVLIAAMLHRWMEKYAAEVARQVEGKGSASQVLAAHMQLTSQADDASNARAAGLIAALLQSPEHLAPIRAWYAEKLEEISTGDPAVSAARRLAFFATEGLFFVRYFGLVPMSREEWESNFAQLRALAPKEAN